MCSYLNPVCDAEKVVGSASSHVAGSVFGAVAKSFADAAVKVTSWMWTVIAQTTQVNLSGGWFRSTLGITTTLAGVAIVAIFALELVKATLRREPAAIGRAVVGVGAGVLGSVAAIGVVEALLVATDAVSNGIVRTTGLQSLGKLGSKIAPTAAISGVGAPALILVLGLGYLIASFFVWALFIMRKAMIIVAAVFAPVAFSGAASRTTSGWVRKWIEFTVAMVFSKIVVVIIFTLALSLVGSPGKGMAAVGTLFTGLAMMVIACFAPWMLFKLVHFIGGDVISAHHQSVQQSVVAAGATPANMARSGAMRVAGVVGGGGGAGVAAGSAGGASTSGTRSAAAAPTASSPGKPIVNNPVIKGVSGGPAGGSEGGGGTGPQTPPGPPSPPAGGAGRPAIRPQPAPLPVSP